jgi:predicted dinucleotide-binding enzyme
MKTITVLGTGVVGQTIANKLILLGYHVVMGSRTADNAKGLAWVEVAGNNARLAAFADAVLASHIVFNCTKGALSAEILSSIGADQFAGKIVIDLANPLDFSVGFPPTLTLSNTDSLGETLQRNLPNAHIVKALNTMNCNIMVNPNLVANGDHDVFICGNDAKTTHTRPRGHYSIPGIGAIPAILGGCDEAYWPCFLPNENCAIMI